ncbi:hypothetical protein PFISCL1PPCAC_26718, partial [Pristionchus fissidentatus]
STPARRPRETVPDATPPLWLQQLCAPPAPMSASGRRVTRETREGQPADRRHMCSDHADANGPTRVRRRTYGWDNGVRPRPHDALDCFVLFLTKCEEAHWRVGRVYRLASRVRARVWRKLSGHEEIVSEDYLDTDFEDDDDLRNLILNEKSIDIQMNSRPSRSIKLDLSSPGNYAAPTPIAVEPRANYKVGVITVAMRLPTGGKPYTPNGTSGLALGSALCQLTPSQEQHLRTSAEGETRPKRNDKLSRFFPFMSRGDQ